MLGPALLAAKAALLLSDEQTRKRIGYAVAAVFVPLVLVVAFCWSPALRAPRSITTPLWIWCSMEALYPRP